MPGGVVNWSVSKFRMIALIWVPNPNSAVFPQTPYLLDITRAQVGWELNGIPTAQVGVAVGREATSGLAANIHYLVDKLKMQLPFQLYLQATEYANSYGIALEQWPADPFLIFEGYTAGTGMSCSSTGQAEFSISLIHWLTDLNFSSCLSRTTTAMNPAQLSKAAAIGGFGVLPAFDITSLADDFFDSASIQEDFWGLCLRPWLNELAQQQILVDPDDPILNDPVNSINYEAQRALNRFEPFVAPNGQQTYSYGVPLATAPEDVFDVDSAADAISQDVSAETADTMGSTTFWDKLVGAFGPSYLFSVVPMVRTALIVPFQPGIAEIWQTIYAEEYDSISLNGDTPRALRGVRMFGGFGDQFGALGLAQGQADAQTSIGGAFDNPTLTDGMLRYFNTPRWLSSIVSSDVFGLQAIAPGGIRANAMQPGVGQPLVGFRPVAIRQQARPLMNLFAQSVYVNEVLQGRTGTLRGKLRFDIGVGSSVQIKISEEPFVYRQLGGTGVNSMFGSVRRVTHVLDAEGPSASTTFDIGWLRSPLENTLDGTSVNTHPLWAKQWLGAPNVDMIAFNPIDRANPPFGFGI